MKITGKVEKEYNRTLQLAHVELSNVKLSNPYISRFSIDNRQDERELFKTLNQIEDLRVYGVFSNFKVEVDDIVEADGTLELVDNMWFFKSEKLINVKESSTHDERLFARFRKLSHATPVEPW